MLNKHNFSEYKSCKRKLSFYFLLNFLEGLKKLEKQFAKSVELQHEYVEYVVDFMALGFSIFLQIYETYSDETDMRMWENNYLF